MPRIRIYQSAMQDVKYVLGGPVKFDPRKAEARAKLKAKLIELSRSVYDS